MPAHPGCLITPAVPHWLGEQRFPTHRFQVSPPSLTGDKGFWRLPASTFNSPQLASWLKANFCTIRQASVGSGNEAFAAPGSAWGVCLEASASRMKLHHSVGSYFEPFGHGFPGSGCVRTAHGMLFC